MDLAEFLAAQMRAPAEAWNCCTLPADWAIERGHPDFAAAWRGVTDAGLCGTVADSAGGLVHLWDQGIGNVLPSVSDLAPGDIGVITEHRLEAGAIWTGDRWVMRTARRLLFVHPISVDLIKAWRP